MNFLKELKDIMKESQVDFFLLPNSDEFFSEYLPEDKKRVKFISGFDGSNATLIFGQKRSYFFTDGRYILQAKSQIDNEEFEIINIAETSVISWLQDNILSQQKIAVDEKLVSTSFINSCKSFSENFVFLAENPVDIIQKKYCANPIQESKNHEKVFCCPPKACGKESLEKCKKVLKNFDADILLITKPENLCWLLNIRSSDLDFTPIFLAYGLISKNGEITLFASKERLIGIDLSNVKIVEPHDIEKFFSQISVEDLKIQTDFCTTNQWLYNILQKNNFSIINKNCPLELLKSVKNSDEIEGAKKAHHLDGLAIVKFLCWLNKKLDEQIELDEITLEKKLLEIRKSLPSFYLSSFDTISSFGSNGAIIHYHATEKTNKFLWGDSLYLFDSGAHYLSNEFYGTTDVTRTIRVGNPSYEMILDYTLVLKGHINLARAKFPRGTTGANLDAIARFNLWQFGKDYDHGTGHGVGSFLSVHEGPCGISKRSHQELLPGMILSNEPGFYKKDSHGIRLENLMLVSSFDEKFLCFETLTLAPFDPSLIDFKMLTYPEKKWLREYHLMVFQKLYKGLNSYEREWLKKICEEF